MSRRVARTRASGEWTEARFWGFIRSHLRLMSRSWPPRRHALVAARHPYRGPNKRQKWLYQCASCLGLYPATEVQVDHIEPCGSLTKYSDVARFIQRLLCEEEGFQVLCKACHLERRNES